MNQDGNLIYKIALICLCYCPLNFLSSSYTLFVVKDFFKGKYSDEVRLPRGRGGITKTFWHLAKKSGHRDEFLHSQTGSPSSVLFRDFKVFVYLNSVQSDMNLYCEHILVMIWILYSDPKGVHNLYEVESTNISEFLEKRLKYDSCRTIWLESATNNNYTSLNNLEFRFLSLLAVIRFAKIGVWWFLMYYPGQEPYFWSKDLDSSMSWKWRISLC